MAHAQKIRTGWKDLRQTAGSAVCRNGRRLFVEMACPLRVRQGKDRNWQEPDQRSHALLRMHAGRSERLAWGGKTHARTVGQIAALHLLDQYPPALQQPKQYGLSKLRRSRDSRLRRVAQFRDVSARHGPNLAARTNDRSYRYGWAVFARKLPLGANVRAVEDTPLTWPQTRGWQPQQAVPKEPGAA